MPRRQAARAEARRTRVHRRPGGRDACGGWRRFMEAVKKMAGGCGVVAGRGFYHFHRFEAETKVYSASRLPGAGRTAARCLTAQVHPLLLNRSRSPCDETPGNGGCVVKSYCPD